MSDAHNLFEVSDGIAPLTLNRPASPNAITAAMGNTSARLAREVDTAPQIKVLRVTDGRALAAGLDINMPDDPGTPRQRCNRAQYRRAAVETDK